MYSRSKKKKCTFTLILAYIGLFLCVAVAIGILTGVALFLSYLITIVF